MAETQATKAAPKAAVSFTVELGDDNNRSITLSCLRQRCRGRWSISTLHARPQGGRDVGQAMSAMPDVPGIRVHVDGRSNSYRLYDPLWDDPSLLDRINNVARRARLSGASVPFAPVEEVTAKADDDLFKTLVDELVRKVKDGQARVVEGKLPTERQIEQLPGRLLNDPLNSGRKPKYRDEVAEWERDLDARAV